jgi:Cu(I)/Ag(I) efflux system membrane fusion protein
MKPHAKILTASLLMIATFLALLAGCSKPGPENLPQGVSYYTCPMHPSVKAFDAKAKCPICNMNLVPVLKNGGTTNAAPSADHNHAEAPTNETASAFSVAPERLQMIGVTFTNAEIRSMRRHLRTVGIVSPQKRRHWDFVSRVDGYIETLGVSSKGEMVTKDRALLTIYSPEVLTTEQELVNLLRIKDEGQASGNGVEGIDPMIGAAERRLRLWNVADADIDQLKITRIPSNVITLRSPFDGVIQDLPVGQGQRVAAGEHLMDVADLSAVWVWADFFQDEAPFLKTGAPVKIHLGDHQSTPLMGTIEVLDPFIKESSRTVRARIDVENSSNALRPEMYVEVEMEILTEPSLAIPKTALLPTGARSIVFIDRGAGRLEPRQVEAGSRSDEFVEIRSGLKNGDRVVNGANFLVDAEARIQGALKTW